MITLKKIKIISEKGPDEIISRLKWKTNQVEYLLFAKTRRSEANTRRPFIGKYFGNKGKLKMTRVRPSFQSFLPQIVVISEIKKEKNKTKLILNYQLGILTTILAIIAVYGMIMILEEIIANFNKIEIIWDGIIWLLMIPILGTVLTFLELNKTTEEIKRIIE